MELYRDYVFVEELLGFCIRSVDHGSIEIVYHVVC